MSDTFQNTIPKLVDILTNTGKLVQILQKENMFLEQRQVNQIGSLSDEKKEILEYLEKAKVLIAQNPDIVEEANEEMVTKLKELNRNLAEVSSRNEMLLKRAITVNSMVVEIVNKVIKREKEMMLGYNKDGSYGNRITENIGVTALTYNNNI